MDVLLADSHCSLMDWYSGKQINEAAVKQAPLYPSLFLTVPLIYQRCRKLTVSNITTALLCCRIVFLLTCGSRKPLFSFSYLPDFHCMVTPSLLFFFWQEMKLGESWTLLHLSICLHGDRFVPLHGNWVSRVWWSWAEPEPKFTYILQFSTSVSFHLLLFFFSFRCPVFGSSVRDEGQTPKVSIKPI